MKCPSCQAENDPSASACAHCGARLDSAPTAVVVSVDLSPGTLFHGRYEILGPLGHGGMGMVYKAHDRTLDEVVAIKVLRPDFAQDPKMTERFRSEIKLARKVRHRNVCTIHDYGEDRGLLFISMEFIEGVDLKRLLRERGGLPAEEAYDLAVQVADGLQAVHDAGIIHRDLKTPNIIRDAQGVARLMDFGIAKRQGEGTLTATGHIVGTPEYMSPEQAQGKKVDFRSDIYALGIVTYEIFTGQVPFRGETPISTILKHLHDPPPLDGPQAIKIPAALKPVLRKALAKESAERYASARELAQALGEARSPSRRQQPIPTEVLRAPTLERRAPRPLLQSWLLAVPIVAVGVGVVLMARHGAAPAPSPGAVSMAGPVPSTLAAIPPPPAPETIPPTLAPAPPPRHAAVVPTPAPAAAFALPTTAPSPLPRPTPTPAALATPSPPSAVTAAPSPAPPPRTAAEGPGFLLVVVRPWASVTLDGKDLGETPLDRIPLASGSHTVRLRHPSYEPIEKKVTIRAGQTERVVVDLPSESVRKP